MGSICTAQILPDAVEQRKKRCREASGRRRRSVNMPKPTPISATPLSPAPISKWMIETTNLTRTFKSRGARVAAVKGIDLRVGAAEVLAMLDLEAAADRVTGSYSGGMRRRLDVGLGIVHRPTVLFLDEPTTGLDPQARARMWQEIEALREQGTTVFLTTHYLEEADALCDRLAIIDNGRIVAEGTSDELKDAVAGDVVTIGVNGSGPRVLTLVEAQPYVREASYADDTGLVRLYVDRGDQAIPHLLRLLDSAGFAST